MSIRIKTHLSFATVIAVYAPTNPKNTTSEAHAPSASFYDDLQTVVSAAPSSDMIVVLGDFNACVDPAAARLSSILGLHCLDQCNENGERLLDFCACNQLVITNTWFQHKPLHQATWYRNGDHSNPGQMLDYVHISSRFSNCVLDTRVFCSTYLESDHELCVSTVKFKIKTK